VTDLSHWDQADSFDQHEAACLFQGLEPESVERDDLDPRVKPIHQRIKDAYYRAVNYVGGEIDPPEEEEEDGYHVTDIGRSANDRLLSCDLEMMMNQQDYLAFRGWFKEGRDVVTMQRFSRANLVEWITTNGISTAYAFDQKVHSQLSSRSADVLVFKNSTDLLRKLHAAQLKLWGLYDSSDHSTAPTNQQVTDYLTQQGVSLRTARIMATILRADEIPMGRR
jgi:hypothetical protein